MYPLFKLWQILARATLDLSRHDCPSLVDLLDHVVHHDTRLVVFQLAGLEVSKGSLNGIGAFIFP
jgi:hypothetical protein